MTCTARDTRQGEETRISDDTRLRTSELGRDQSMRATGTHELP